MTASSLKSRLTTPVALASAMALALLAMTLAWHIPLMLWDHLDLVPMYVAWQNGELGNSIIADVHGGHVHTSAYAVLLLTTWLSGGQPWLDCLVNWLVLVVYAAIVLRFAAESRADDALPGLWMPTMILLCLYPGHLANLQWGWQIAVFLCLASAASGIALLTRTRLDAWRNLAALLAMLIAVSSFATGIAMIPTALVLIARRSDLAWKQRALLIAPWLAAAVWIGTSAMTIADQSGVTPSHAITVIHYALNVIGAGIARFATDAAPWLALAAILVSIPAVLRVRGNLRALPWLGLAVFSLTSALAIAWGRAEPLGTDHAFVTRYVSFSSMFWLGWIGLMASALTPRYRESNRKAPKWLVAAVSAVFVLATVNAAHLALKAARLARESDQIAATLRATWPAPETALLAEIYFDQPDVARQRLQQLHDLGFAPFAD